MANDIRRAREADWAELKTIRLQALQEAPLAFGSTYAREVDFDERTWRERIAHAAQFVAYDDGRPVGMATGFPDPDDPNVVLLFGVFVDPTLRNRGTAGALVDRVLADARSRGLHRVRLHVVEANTVARGLYDRRGFRPTGRRAGLPHTPEVAEIELELDLSTDPASVIEPVSDRD